MTTPSNGARGIRDWIGADTTTTSGPLTVEALDKAFEQMKNAPVDPCRLGKHVVSATALREGWEYATCANCYGLVKLRDKPWAPWRLIAENESGELLGIASTREELVELMPTVPAGTTRMVVRLFWVLGQDVAAPERKVAAYV